LLRNTPHRPTKARWFFYHWLLAILEIQKKKNKKNLKEIDDFSSAGRF
jgi:hypothetical protein